MIIYQNTKDNFNNDILSNEIERIITGRIKEKTGKAVAHNEINALKSSLAYMDRVLNHHYIFSYKIPLFYL